MDVGKSYELIYAGEHMPMIDYWRCEFNMGDVDTFFKDTEHASKISEIAIQCEVGTKTLRAHSRYTGDTFLVERYWIAFSYKAKRTLPWLLSPFEVVASAFRKNDLGSRGNPKAHLEELMLDAQVLGEQHKLITKVQFFGDLNYIGEFLSSSKE
jgi:hypothetical protein